ncbi:CBS domain-containing protein [Gemmata sp.]|uniref:CBS domain-containing protein n=1 Tax=Gemmata sp. TaxID=1914242 RepID=UPI003F6F9663
MLLRDAMTRRVECVGPDDTIQTAARRMRDLDVGPVPICGTDGKLAGMLTDRDIAVRAVAEGHDPKSCKVSDVMTPDVVYCFDDQDTAEASRVMQEKQIRRVLVLNRDKKLVGIVSLGDLVVDAGKQQAGETLKQVSEPAEPRR